MPARPVEPRISVGQPTTYGKEEPAQLGEVILSEATAVTLIGVAAEVAVHFSAFTDENRIGLR